MRQDKKVKDKRIEHTANYKFLAIVEYYQDHPDRYEDRLVAKVFETLTGAQKFLSKFPRDVWDGYDKDDGRYREVDYVPERDRVAFIL
ncbi:MAG: hypothetical protein DRH04_07285 [Deltaproteobacteria bacterium]|nr:MAG: hypothetical protein DRH04_07285 [Deltaproteobacteria bacterium]